MSNSETCQISCETYVAFGYTPDRPWRCPQRGDLVYIRFGNPEITLFQNSLLIDPSIIDSVTNVIFAKILTPSNQIELVKQEHLRLVNGMIAR